MVRAIIYFLLFSLLSINSYSQTIDQDKDLRTIVTLLDYISKDYSAAVDNGKVINEAEFTEMSEFAEKCLTLQNELSTIIKNKKFNELQTQLKDLQKAIANKSDIEIITKYSLSTRNKILNLNILKITPDKYPSLKLGATLYTKTCVSCHGVSGFGDGPASQGLEPTPTNFHKVKLSPLQAYNVIKLGIEGTAMASYNHLTENEKWNLAYYILSLKHKKDDSKIQLPNGINLDSISIWNDEELGQALAKSESNVTVAQIRHYQPETQKPLDLAMAKLNLSYDEFKKGNNKKAVDYALTSYLEGVELVENILTATSPKLVADIERDMIAYRKALQDNDKSAVESNYNNLTKEIIEAKKLLEENDYSFAFIYGSALSILIRESLEALLIILIILSVLRPMKVPKATIAVHSGWLLAIVIGVVSWFSVDTLINLSGASRELMEGVGAIFAVLVLLFAGVWLHSHSEISKWTYFVKNKINTISETGNWIGLFIFSFIVAFREAFEVVLFLSSLKLNSPEVADSAINWALLTSIVAVAILTFIILRYTKKLPFSKIFKLAAYAVVVLAVILAGKGVMAFQEAGYIPITPINFIPQIDLLGLYPNLQAIGSQILTLVIVLFFNWKNSKK